jgi:predicted transcriptional regulator
MSKLTDADKARIGKLYQAEGMSTAKIADLYGLTAPAVVHALKRLGVPLRPPEQSKRGPEAVKSIAAIKREIAERHAVITPWIIQWYKEGLGCHAIKTLLRASGFKRGTDHTAIVKILHKNNIKVRPQGAGGRRGKIAQYVEEGTLCA